MIFKNKVSTVIVLGSSALKIGEAGEFDYAGSQAIKALKEEGLSTILINPNIATIQTSAELADAVYFLPVQPHFVQGVIEKHRPDGILLGFGGQTALNCGLELARQGILQDHGVAVVGTPISAIEITEDREKFAEVLRQIGVPTPRSAAAGTVDQAAHAARRLGYPLMVRAGFSLGGLGSGICADERILRELAGKALKHTPQVLVEECLQGWKEVEYEVVRDRHDNAVTVCNMENLDPLGIHTGESIVVAPSQTLTNEEYHRLREIALLVVRHLGIVGECNIQFALDPESDRYRVIEVNARLSRSSALASKATGYPLALIAAKLGLGHSLLELRNQITQTTTACFEPALDYVVVKVPRWDMTKFHRASRGIGSSMKSVGEVMAIGRKFEESLQKALRMLEIGAAGLTGNDHLRFTDLDAELQHPTDQRVFAVAAALMAGYSIDRIHELTHIDRWFLHKMQNICQTTEHLRSHGSLAPEAADCPLPLLRQAKCLGFSDAQIAKFVRAEEDQVRALRQRYGLRPVVKQIDTLAAEYPAQTNFLYLTYNGDRDDIQPCGEKSILVLGSGVYRIGSSVEFDWCCVNTVMTLKQLGYRTLLVNSNPETVSTDYDQCDRLYFEELTLETIREIYAKERPHGLILSMGGQTPNTLALRLHQAGLHILGTPPAQIDAAEDRKKFSALCDRAGIRQPIWQEFRSVDEAQHFAQRVGYPVLVRPSYVLSGQAMGVAANDQELQRFLTAAATVSDEHPVVLTKFIENAKEFELDAVAKNGEILAHAISEHVENAGVHSGDATLVLPPQRAWLETIRRIRHAARKIAAALTVTGPFNVQFIARENDVQVIECNLRASRSFPFVSKVYGVNFIDLATRAMLGARANRPRRSFMELEHVGVKAPQFSFTRLCGADPVLGVEMHSTGEVGCLGDDFEEALLKAMLSVGYRWPVRSVLLSTGPLESKAEFIPQGRMLAAAGIKMYATRGTADFLRQDGIEAEILHWPLDRNGPTVMDTIADGKLDLVINIPKNDLRDELTNDYLVRRQAVDYNVPLITDLHLAKRFVEALVRKNLSDLTIKSFAEYFPNFPRSPGLKGRTVRASKTLAEGRRIECDNKLAPVCGTVCDGQR